MAPKKLIGPVPSRTPSGVLVGQTARRDIPLDILRAASRRLGILALLGAALWPIIWVQHHLVVRSLGDAHWDHLSVPDGIIAGVLVASIGLFYYSRTSRHDPRTILDVGLGYLVVNAVAFGHLLHWHDIPADTPIFPLITWVGPMMLIFAAIAPSTPGKTLVAGLVAASMMPLAMVIAKARGKWDYGPESNLLLMHYPDLFIACASVLVSHVVRKLGQQVSKARELGSYELGELLGRGGMGEVYRATHRMLARPAAIKLIRPEMLGERSHDAAQLVLRRFRREAEAAAALRSPHTVELYDFGITEDETLYFVMELLDGLDLEAVVQRSGPLPAARVIHILEQICESLEEAHARGLVHRDIKPANIHLGRLGLRHDFVKVLDFGLVKSLAPRAGEGGASLETAAGLTPGTPAYMAPEAAIGGAVDGRADLYAVGCVAYFLLTGHLVFEAATPVHMIAKHLNEAPPPMAQRGELPVPAALEALVLACLAKKPADRPAGAAAVTRALRAIDVPRWTEEDARRWWDANLPRAEEPAAPASAQ